MRMAPYIFPALLVVVAIVSGCNQSRDTAQQNSTKGIADRNNQIPHGPVQAVRGAVGRTVNENDMRNLHIFLENASSATGSMPDKNAIMAQLNSSQDARNLVTAINEGLIVLTGSTQRESVWAYEKNATINVGWVITNNGVERMDANSVKRMLGTR